MPDIRALHCPLKIPTVYDSYLCLIRRLIPGVASDVQNSKILVTNSRGFTIS